jgi:DNA-binding protein H-NS
MKNKMISKDQLDAMSVDDLWNLYDRLRGVLIDKLQLQLTQIDERLETLSNPNELLSRPQRETRGGTKKSRKPYPKPAPQFRNPDDPSQTWAGRGLRPRWLTAHIKAGRKVDDFRISPASHMTTRPKRSAARGS